MMQLFHAAALLGAVRKKLRYGVHSREPLLLLRIEWKGDLVECDCLMRPPDPWDKDLSERAAKENETRQALSDALSLRNALFKAFPAISRAKVRMFRPDVNHQLDLVMIGNIERDNEVLQRVASMVMRTKRCGFQFNLKEGRLETLSAA